MVLQGAKASMRGDTNIVLVDVPSHAAYVGEDTQGRMTIFNGFVNFKGEHRPQFHKFDRPHLEGMLRRDLLKLKPATNREMQLFTDRDIFTQLEIPRNQLADRAPFTAHSDIRRLGDATDLWPLVKHIFLDISTTIDWYIDTMQPRLAEIPGNSGVAKAIRESLMKIRGPPAATGYRSMTHFET